MKGTINMLLNDFVSSSVTTPEFKMFFRTFKKEFTKELESVGAHNITFSREHFYVSGFFTSASGQIYYFSLSDVRDMRFGELTLMYRTAESYKDFTGGMNQWVNIEEGMGEKMRIQ